MTTIDHAYIRNCNCNYLRNYAITKSGPVNTTFSDICGQVTLNLVSTVQHVKLDIHTDFISFHSQLWMNTLYFQQRIIVKILFLSVNNNEAFVPKITFEFNGFGERTEIE